MEIRLIVSGFGGQGIVFGGKLLAEAAMRSSLSTTYFPSYGVAMRGGAAKCDVIISPEEIGSPVIDTADIVVSMSIEAKRKYESLLKPGGTLIYNSSLVSEGPENKDIIGVPIPATDLATELGSPRIATLICLGYAGMRTGMINIQAFYDSLDNKKAKFGDKLVSLNKTAINTGWEMEIK